MKTCPKDADTVWNYKRKARCPATICDKRYFFNECVCTRKKGHGGKHHHHTYDSYVGMKCTRTWTKERALLEAL